MNDLRYLRQQTLFAGLIWTLLLGGFFYYDLDSTRKHTEELARKDARANFNKDRAFRLWATTHGGVYVPMTAQTPPNPALAHIPERDIVTPAGKQLTLMNPAYVVRQLMEEFGELYGIKGKITSFKLMNPKNAPDAWETGALHKFEQGAKEVFEFAEIDGQPYLRLMGAMPVEPGCLKCHGFQGYKVGEIRGGVGVAVPMRPYLDDLDKDIRKAALIFGATWLFGLAGLAVFYVFGKKRLVERAATDALLQQQTEAIEKANAELTQFANISAHHLMEPSRRLVSFAQRLRAKIGGTVEDEDVQASLGFIEQGATRMRDLVRDIERYLAASTPRGPLRPNDAAAAVAEVQQRLAQAIRDSGAQFDIAAASPVHLDRPRLVDLFEVLLGNALTHARPGVAPRIRVGVEAQGALVRLRVDDNGPGIPEEYRQRVFGVFERLSAATQAGTGIGLAIARRIVDSRGGRIWIETSPLGGAAVVCELPGTTESEEP